MIPTPWVAVVLALGTYRVVRLCGWDDFPPVAKARAWMVGETAYYNTAVDRDNAILRFRRPVLHHFLNCAFCQGFWWSVVVYLAWRFEPVWTVTALAPLALAAAVGLIAKNLDP